MNEGKVKVYGFGDKNEIKRGLIHNIEWKIKIHNNRDSVILLWITPVNKTFKISDEIEITHLVSNRIPFSSHL